MISALIFDVDGTLAETEEAHREAFNRTFAANGLNWRWSRDDYRALLRTTGGKERMKAHIAANALPPLSDARIAELHAQKTKAYAELLAQGGLSLRPGVDDLIRRARHAGMKLAVATTTSPGNVEALCQCCWGRPAAELFDVIAAGDEVAAKKPAPDVFLLALDRLGLTAAEAIAFEDSLNGLRSARSAGLRVVVTPGLYTAHEDFTGADWLLPDLSALPADLSETIVAAPA